MAVLFFNARITLANEALKSSRSHVYVGLNCRSKLIKFDFSGPQMQS